MAEKTHFYVVYVSQNGSKLTALLTEADVKRLYRAVYHEGLPVGIWTTYENPNRSVGIFLVPRRGGLVINMEEAAAIPLDPSGQVVTPEGIQAYQQAGRQGEIHWLQPSEQRCGEVVVPPWAGDEVEASEAMVGVAEFIASRPALPVEAAAPVNGATVQAMPTPAPQGASEGTNGSAGPPFPPRPQTAQSEAPPPPSPTSRRQATEAGMTEYQKLQRVAKEWGVHPLNQKAEVLREKIEEAQARAAAANRRDQQGVA